MQRCVAEEPVIVDTSLRERMDGIYDGRGGGREVTADFLDNFASHMEVDYGAHAQPPPFGVISLRLPSEGRGRLLTEN